jgi:hypothetical protein
MREHHGNSSPRLPALGSYQLSQYQEQPRMPIAVFIAIYFVHSLFLSYARRYWVQTSHLPAASVYFPCVTVRSRCYVSDNLETHSQSLERMNRFPHICFGPVHLSFQPVKQELHTVVHPQKIQTAPFHIIQEECNVAKHVNIPMFHSHTPYQASNCKKKAHAHTCSSAFTI